MNINFNEAFLFAIIFAVVSSVMLYFTKKKYVGVNLALCLILPPIGWIYFIYRVFSKNKVEQ